jgi:hypothetical protein
MELLHSLLDLGDAISAAVGWVAFWYTWVGPAGRPTRSPGPSGAGELEQFLRLATRPPTLRSGVPSASS